MRTSKERLLTTVVLVVVVLRFPPSTGCLALPSYVTYEGLPSYHFIQLQLCAVISNDLMHRLLSLTACENFLEWPAEACSKNLAVV